MTIKEAGDEPIHIALEEFDEPVIGINPAPFVARQRLGWRKFLSSWNDATLLQEDDCRGFAKAWSLAPPLKKIFWPKMFPETTH
jgi:hypothetical protein